MRVCVCVVCVCVRVCVCTSPFLLCWRHSNLKARTARSNDTTCESYEKQNPQNPGLTTSQTPEQTTSHIRFQGLCGLQDSRADHRNERPFSTKRLNHLTNLQCSRITVEPFCCSSASTSKQQISELDTEKHVICTSQSDLAT